MKKNVFSQALIDENKIAIINNNDDLVILFDVDFNSFYKSLKENGNFFNDYDIVSIFYYLETGELLMATEVVDKIKFKISKNMLICKINSKMFIFKDKNEWLVQTTDEKIKTLADIIRKKA